MGRLILKSPRMHKGAVTATPDMTVAQAAELMLEKHMGRLPVVDSDQCVIGVITETDPLRALVTMLRQSFLSLLYHCSEKTKKSHHRLNGRIFQGDGLGEVVRTVEIRRRGSVRSAIESNPQSY